MAARFLQGRTALVTGATSGIGLAIARALAGAGAAVAINGLGDRAQIDAALAAIAAAGSAPVRHYGADLASATAIETMLAEIGAVAAPAIVVNCAGVQHTAPLAEMPVATWDRLLAVNLSAAFHTMRLTLPAMAASGYGRVINIASVHGLVGSVHKAPYVASKHGLIGLSKVAALEFAGAGSRASGGVTINCVCPGWVETPLIEPQIAAKAAAFAGDRDAGVRELLREKQPSGRMSLPDDIADVVLWLCRRESHNITGASIPVDGGWTAQ